MRRDDGIGIWSSAARRWSNVCGAAMLVWVAVVCGIRAEEAAKGPAAGRDIAPAIGQTAASDRAAARNLDRHVPNFVVKDSAGETRALAEYGDKRAVVLVFVSTECPIANEYLPIVDQLAKKYADQSVQFLAIYSSPSDDAAKIAAHVKQFEIKIPALYDQDQQILRAAGAERTAEALVLDARRVVRYRGRIDDRFGYNYHRDSATQNDLEAALDELLAHREISTATTPVQGCLISLRKPDHPPTDVTYSNQVVRILQDKCQSCHRPGTVAPFSLLEPDDAVHWADMIKQVVQERRMPPWHADSRYGKFENDRRLSQDQIDTLVSWIDAGTPLGDKSRMPPPRTFAEGWTIGEPDVVFELPEEVTVASTGTVPYQFFETPTNFKEDVWIQAAEARPGNRKAVHHIIAFYRDPKLPEKQRVQDQWIAGTAPGDMALVLPPGVGRRIPAGATIVWQMHYTPTGKEEKDRSQLGLIFYKGKDPPEHNVESHGIGNHRFLIRAGEPNYKVESDFTLPRDATVLSFMPHMHLRGKDFLYRATYPDGRSETLLSVPRYDFAWQSTYRCAEPLQLPKGTRLHCTAHYDNSADNPANPDPTKSIRWGDQTWDEMMIGYVDFYWNDAAAKK
ncbi:MAG TPA: redoxin domain-containing protein [Pirellulales bacterium]|nr:redoxin domain-containing protein [Pirellulales bacterium]